jgi:hypothetical protein
MPASKTGGSLPASKSVFDAAKAKAAETVMQPDQSAAGGRNRKGGGRGIRISGYLPVEIEAALRDEVIKRTVAERRSVSLNDVLCSILSDWLANRKEAQ